MQSNILANAIGQFSVIPVVDSFNTRDSEPLLFDVMLEYVQYMLIPMPQVPSVDASKTA